MEAAKQTQRRALSKASRQGAASQESWVGYADASQESDASDDGESHRRLDRLLAERDQADQQVWNQQSLLQLKHNNEMRRAKQCGRMGPEERAVMPLVAGAGGLTWRLPEAESESDGGGLAAAPKQLFSQCTFAEAAAGCAAAAATRCEGIAVSETGGLCGTHRQRRQRQQLSSGPARDRLQLLEQERAYSAQLEARVKQLGGELPPRPVPPPPRVRRSRSPSAMPPAPRVLTEADVQEMTSSSRGGSKRSAATGSFWTEEWPGLQEAGWEKVCGKRSGDFQLYPPQVRRVSCMHMKRAPCVRVHR